MEIDLRRYGLLGNNLAPEPRPTSSRPSSERITMPTSKGLAADMAKLFNVPPENDSGTDFTITALKDGEWDEDEMMSSSMMRDEQGQQNWLSPDTTTSSPKYIC